MEKIAELLVRREYAKLGIQLPEKFWNLPEYKRKYQTQCRFAAKFLRSFDKEVILSVLEKEKWCYSLAAKILPEKFAIEKHKRNLQNEAAKSKVVETPKEEHIKVAAQFRTQTRKTFKEDG